MGRRSRIPFAVAVAATALSGLALLRWAADAPPGTGRAGGAPREPGGPAAAGGADDPGPEAAPVPLPESSLAGVVVDRAGRGIPGAEVVVAAEGDRLPRRTSSDEAGRFRVDGLPRGAALTAGARAPGWAPCLAGGLRPGGAPVRLVLRRPFLLRGRVLDPSGAARPGTLVRAVLRFPGATGAGGALETRTDPAGRYAFEGLGSPGEVAAFGEGESSAPLRWEPPEEAEGAEVVRDLVLESGPGVEGFVRDGLGRPLAGVAVSAVGAEGRAAWTDSGEDGAFTLRGAGPGPWKVEARDRDGRFRRAVVEGVLPPRADLALVLEEDPEAPGFFAWRCLGGEEPVRGLRFLLRREGEKAPLGSGSAAAREDGAFRSARTPPGRYLLEVRGPGGRAEAGPFEVLAGATTDLGTLVLGPGAAVLLRVEGPEGGLPEGLEVFAGDDPWPERTRPGEEGSFLLRGLPPGAGEVRIRHPRMEIERRAWTAGPGETADLGTVRLRAATGAVEGTVSGGPGPPPPGTVVRLTGTDRGNAGVERRIAVAPDGRFSLRGVPAGEWTPAVLAPDAANPRFLRGRSGEPFPLREGERAEIRLPLPR